MTHIYQPLMIKTILESSNNTATRESIARSFVDAGGYLEYYIDRVAKWPHQTLIKHKIVTYDRKTKSYTLQIDKDLTTSQRNRLVELCKLRQQEFEDKNYKILDRRTKRTDIGYREYDVLAKSKGICVACGAKSTDVKLDIDHIVPASKGGNNSIDNLQALCYRCNRQKRDRDNTDFLLWHKQMQFAKNPKCRLCGGHHKSELQNKMAYGVIQGDECYVAPKRHINSFTEMIPVERHLSMILVDQVMNKLKQDLPKTKFQLHGSDNSRKHYRICIIKQ